VDINRVRRKIGHGVPAVHLFPHKTVLDNITWRRFT
jgi:ABC-type proline/glycine betaine transport system ATPase subunit